MFDIWHEAIRLVREKRQLNKDLRQLHLDSLDYNALQNIVNTVSEKNVEITIAGKERTMVIKPIRVSDTGYKSFDERYQEARNG